MTSRRGFARRLAARQLRDLGIVERRQQGDRDADGNLQTTYDDQPPIRCLLNMRSTQNAAEQGVALGVLYVEPDVVIRAADRFRLTHRSGEVLDRPLRFEVSGPPIVQTAVLVVNLVSITEQPT